MTDLKQKDLQIKDAQFRKGLSIAFFNANNSAIALMAEFVRKDDKPNRSAEEIREKLKDWRDWFLDEHREYYATVIANVGANYKADDSVKKLKDCKTLDELKEAWLMLSEDERRDDEIKKVAKEMKQSYEKA